jgi:glycosyltransferase involved in cell wall biosynthesis
MRIGLSGKILTAWAGGLDFLGLCAAGLAASKAAYELVLLFPVATRKQKLRAFLESCRDRIGSLTSEQNGHRAKRVFPGTDVVFSSLLGSFIQPEQITCFADGEAGLKDAVRKGQFDLVLPLMTPASFRWGFPWIGYIPDLQHRFLPELFSRRERTNRDRVFQKVLQQAHAVIVNSRDTASNLQCFYQFSPEKLFTLPFTPFPVFPMEDKDREAACLDRLEVPQQYFLICNQFWVHKSHATAFEALRILHEQSGSREVQILCTGDTRDYRHPEYFDSLQAKLREMGLSRHVRFLGFIPKLDQIALMKHALAVIQPTLFEGGPGGGSVFQAIAQGVPAIVSDIPVNREIDEPGMLFFRVKSALDLANKMQSVMICAPPRPTQAELDSRLRQRMAALSEQLDKVIRFALAHSGK